MRKTARPVVWEGDGAQSPSLDPIHGVRPTNATSRALQATFNPQAQPIGFKPALSGSRLVPAPRLASGFNEIRGGSGESVAALLTEVRATSPSNDISEISGQPVAFPLK